MHKAFPLSIWLGLGNRPDNMEKPDSNKSKRDFNLLD